MRSHSHSQVLMKKTIAKKVAEQPRTAAEVAEDEDDEEEEEEGRTVEA